MSVWSQEVTVNGRRYTCLSGMRLITATRITRVGPFEAEPKRVYEQMSLYRDFDVVARVWGVRRMERAIVADAHDIDELPLDLWF